MKKTKGILMVLLTSCLFAACSKNNEDTGLPEYLEQERPVPLYDSNDLTHNRKTHIETFDEWTTCVDDEGRHLWAGLSENAIPKDIITVAPSSYQNLDGKFFNLNNGHSLELDTVVYYTDYEDYSRKEEFYKEYYRGVPVLAGQYSFLYYCNSEEQYLYHCSGYFQTFDNLDVTPSITGEQAMQTFSAYLNTPIDTSWTADLYAREYHVKTEKDTFRIEQRLVYYVTGPARKAKVWGGIWLNEIDSNDSAEIDAHTGQIVYVGMKHFIPF